MKTVGAITFCHNNSRVCGVACTARIVCWISVLLFQKEATGALTHGGAHLDLSAFSSWEVRVTLKALQS